MQSIPLTAVRGCSTSSHATSIASTSRMYPLPVNLGRDIVSQALDANRRQREVHQRTSTSGNVHVASSMIQPAPLKGDIMPLTVVYVYWGDKYFSLTNQSSSVFLLALWEFDNDESDLKEDSEEDESDERRRS